MQNTLLRKSRLLWPDYAKAIGLFFVILGHIRLNESMIHNWIFSFHMPLFFILSGYFEKKTSFRDVLKKNIRTLLIPYSIFYLISFVWWFLNEYILHSSANFTFYKAIVLPLLGMFFAEGRDTLFSKTVNEPLWFLVGLFFCKLLFHISLNLSKKYWILILINFIAILIVLMIKQLSLNILLSIDTAIMALPFYTFGYFFNKIRLEKIITNRTLTTTLSASFVIVGYLLCQINGEVDMNYLIYGNNIIVFYINGIVGSLGIILLCMIFSNTKYKLFLYLGSNSLVAFALHGIFILLVRKLYFSLIIRVKMPDFYSFTTSEGILISFVVLFVLVIPIYIINKYFPFIIGKSYKF